MIYLDNAATTKIHPEVLSVMDACAEQAFANPGSIHSAGWYAKQLVEEARAQVAKVVRADPQNIIFTSGGSEANALALLGAADHLREAGRTHILISSIEHKSVLNCGKRLTELGFDVEYIPATETGKIDPNIVLSMVRPETGLVSVMKVNNETGVVNEIQRIAEHCHSKGILFHTDCVQAYGKWYINVTETPIDFLSVSAHKLHGPKGVGCLYARDRSILKPLIPGGSQEFGLRAGTENVQGIVGFGKAAEISQRDWAQEGDEPEPDKTVECRGVYDLLTHVRLKLKDICHVNGAPPLFGLICSLRFDGVSGESLVLLLSSKGVMVSAGSACTSNSNKPSHVLKAMGLTDEEARSSIRISVAEGLTARQTDEAAEAIVSSVLELRKAAGYKD